jgi:glycosyltransferase involved in cell wall biosynthesis
MASVHGRKIALIAYACHPVEGSEPGVGWQTLKSLVRLNNDVVVITRGNNVSAIEAGLDSHPRVQVVAHDLARVFQWLKKRAPGGTQLYYLFWQISLRRKLSALHLTHRFQLAHHVTFAVDWMPSAITALPDSVSKVWGPVGGATTLPRRFAKYVGAWGMAEELVRRAAGDLGRQFFGRRIARTVDLTIAQNGDVERYFAQDARSLEVEPNVLIDPTSLRREASQAARSTFRVIGVGRLVRWKGWALAIYALRFAPQQFTLELYGGGPDRRRLERLVSRLRLDGRVVFHGWQPRSVVMDAVATAACLVHPSFHDSAAGAIGEALTLGCPTVALDLGGSGDIVRGAGGVVLDPHDIDLERLLAAAFQRRIPPTNTDRWLADRLDGLLTRWYAAADGDRRGDH